MPVMIGQNYKIESDKLNLILYSNFPPDLEKSERMKQNLRVKLGNDVVFKDHADKWQPEGYFSNLRNLVKYIAELELRLTDIKDLQTITDRMDAIYKLIEQVCPNITVSDLKGPKTRAKDSDKTEQGAETLTDDEKCQEDNEN